MKRFITYLYECEKGNKAKNVGFIKVNVRNDETSMELCIKNYVNPQGNGKIYGLIYKKDLCGVELGEIIIANGQSTDCITLQTENIMERGFALNDIVGIGICLENGEYIASCWKDEYADEIVRGEFRMEEIGEEENAGENSTHSEMPLIVAEESQVGQHLENLNNNSCVSISDKKVSYTKIDLSQIRDLPSPNWYLATNSFLVHGCWNYGYLVLKKEMEEDKEKLSLGIPGVFEKPEAVMAVLFGFPTFEEIPPEVVEMEMNQDREFSYIEKNQESKTGVFGCWFLELQN